MDAILREKLLKLPPKGEVINCVIDTDAFNECDDLFAYAWALLSPERLNVMAVYAAPFLNPRAKDVKDGMELSYKEIVDTIATMDVDVKVLRGSETTYTKTGKAVSSPAALDLVERAKAASPDKPLYIIALGPLSNVASAMLLEPAIIDNIVVLWQGCGVEEENWKQKYGDCNIQVDIEAARHVLNSGAAIILLPGSPVTSHLSTTTYELEHYLKGKTPLGDFLIDRYKLWEEYWADEIYAWSKPLWDVAVPAILINENWCRTVVTKCPYIEKGFGTVQKPQGEIKYSWDKPELRYDPEFEDTKDPTEEELLNRHNVLVVYELNRNAIFADMFSKIEGKKL